MESPSSAYAPRLLDHLGIEWRRLEPIVGKGTVNEVFRIDGPADGSTILRLNHDRDAEEALHEYHREAWCMGKAAEAGIPSPVTFGYGTWEGRSWMHLSFIPGPTADEVPEANGETWRFLGNCLRRLETLELDSSDPEVVERFGRETPAELWERQLAYNLASLTPEDPLIGHGVYPPERQPEVRAWFRSLEGRALRYGLAHGDFSRRNVILSPEGSVLIDWGCSTRHIVPHYEIVEAIRNAADGDPDAEGFAAFAEGYGGFDDLQPMTKALRLLRAFDLVRWAIDRCPNRIEELAGHARRDFEAVASGPREEA